MQANKQRLEELFDKWRTHATQESESEELMELLQEASKEEKEVLMKKAYDGTTQKDLFTTGQIENMANFILGKEQSAPVFTIRRWLAAASIILLIGIGAYFILFQKGRQQPISIARTGLPADVKAPSAARAMITLADGRIVYLDSANNGSLATVEGVQLVKQADGKIVYMGAATEMVYNTLTNPRGSRVIDMTLTDGSRVWLNAGSSLTYPVAFVGNERKVTVTGEAYFEVIHHPDKPFKVSKGGMEVTVLGTHFNVNAYEDEEDIKVTLLEGSVEVSQESEVGSQIQKVRIKPGEQAILSQKSQSSTQIPVQTADLEQVLAWKNGLFQFKDAGIETVMRQIARWYDVEVVYEARPTELFRGELPRNMSAASVLKVLEETGGVHFTIEGRKVMVTK